MKLNTFLCGVLCLGALSACSEEMDYHEYNNYDEDFVKLNFGNVGGLITNIYSDLDTDFGSYSGAVAAPSRRSTTAPGVRSTRPPAHGAPATAPSPTATSIWNGSPD